MAIGTAQTIARGGYVRPFDRLTITTAGHWIESVQPGPEPEPEPTESYTCPAILTVHVLDRPMLAPVTTILLTAKCSFSTPALEWADLASIPVNTAVLDRPSIAQGCC